MFDQPFDRDEYLARVARVRQEMAPLGLDGLLLTSGPNLTYLSGYPSPPRAGSRPFIFLLPQGGTPILIVHTGRELEARGYSWVEEIRTYHALSRAPLAEIIEALQDAGLAQGRVGAELGAEQSLDVPVGDFLELRRRLPAVRFADAGRALWPARMRKSAAEIACVRAACAATTRAYESTFEQARAGMTEADVARHMTVASLEAGGANPWVIITSGAGNYDLASKLPSHRRLEPGDFVWMDSGCTAGGYWSDFGRAGVVGGRRRRSGARRTASTKSPRPASTRSGRAPRRARSPAAAMRHWRDSNSRSPPASATSRRASDMGLV